MSESNFIRKLSSSIPHNPGPPTRKELNQVYDQPAIFDSRYLAWKIRNPNHSQANDPNVTAGGGWPRQQRLDTCNLLQLYHHLEYLILDYQTAFTHWEGKSNVLLMPYALIEPKPGWKLIDLETDLEYTVKAVLASRDIEGNSTFDGRVLLEESVGPPQDHLLRWSDQFGEVDGVTKVVRFINEEALSSILSPQTGSDDGDMADVRSKPFTPAFSYSLVRHEPGSVDNHPFGPNRELKPRFRESFTDPSDPNIHQLLFGQWMDCIVEFKAHAIGGKTADRMTLWLRNFFMLYTGVLKLLGVQEILYWTTSRDSMEARPSYNLSVRTIQYYFRLEELLVRIHSALKSYNLAVRSLTDMDPVPWFTSEPVIPFPTDTSGAPLYGYPDLGDQI